MNMPPDIIAGSLSASQRAALIAFCSRVNSPWGYYATDLGVSGAACSALARKGCLTGGLFPGERMKAYRWTEKGAEVFAYLQAQGGVTEGRDSVAGSGPEGTSTRSAESGCAQGTQP
jgi:hypothetical protein